MDEYEQLQEALHKFAALTDADIAVSQPFWRTRKIARGEFFNMQNFVCTDLGLVLKGIFRIYYIDPDTEEEHNVFFFTEGQFVVSFRSFIHQYPCHYYIQAMEDAEIIAIKYHNLQELYKKHAAWEHFGRLLAELFFNYSQARTEELLFLNPEKRYLKLLEEHPGIVDRIALYHISSYLGIKNPSLSRIRKRLSL
jgi:CRP-like cAMP-binding protein